MSLLKSLKKRYINDIMKNDPRFMYSREEQERIISKYSDPSDLIERSYFQFRVQKDMMGAKSIFYDIAALILVPYKRVTIPKQVGLIKKCNLVCSLAGIKESMVPVELIGEYESVQFYYNTGEECLDRKDKEWFSKNIVKRYPFSFFFQLKILSRLANYSYMKHAYSPDAIANHCEYSCGSSAMTQYCHDMGIRHIDFMHGEKPYYIRDSFFMFDKCYVWNEHYIKLFSELKAGDNSFAVAVPPQFLEGKSFSYDSISKIPYSDYCYYFANEPKDQIDRIISALKRLIESGYSCRIRLHPRWGDHEYIKMMAEDNDIVLEEDGVDINESIMNADGVISLFSTVLFQSYILGKTLIIDDVSSPERFAKLKKLDYIAFSLPHKLLSEL